MSHIKIEYYNADFKEQMLFHLDKNEQEIIKKLFETKDSSKIREFIDNRLDEVGVDADAWWYDEPYNLRMGIEVDNKEYDSGHASEFVYEDTIINAQSQCPNIHYMEHVCGEAGEDPEDYCEGNEILMITAGNEAAEQMLEDAAFWNDYAEKCEREIMENTDEDTEFDDYMYAFDRTSHMCLFDSFLNRYGLDEQLVLIESLQGEGERSIEFDIEDEFDIDKLKFIYDYIQNPEASADEQIMMDRVVYDNKLYGEFEFFRCHYNKDKFVLATINKSYPGWLQYISEIELKNE